MKIDTVQVELPKKSLTGLSSKKDNITICIPNTWKVEVVTTCSLVLKLKTPAS